MGILFRLGRIIVLLALVFGLPGGPVVAQPRGPARSEPWIDILIGFRNRPRQPEHALVRVVGGEVRQGFRVVPVVAARIPARARATLERMPGVKYVELDAPVFALQQTVPWGVTRVLGGGPYPFATWDGSRGLGIAVAVLDTGIDRNHVDLASLAGGVNTIDQTDWGTDGHGHGTHVAGTIAALDNTAGVVGVAPSVELYAVKVLNSQGSGTISSVVAGIDWVVRQQQEQGRFLPVLNLSLGSTSPSQTLKNACDAAYAAGHLVVAAAGNSGTSAGTENNVQYPAAYASVIAVAASRSNDARASFSSTGPAVELIAPGEGVLSTYPANRYRTFSGTSMASPHVAGAAALVWAANPFLRNDEVRDILQLSAENLGLPANHQGYGLVRADRAVALAVALSALPASTVVGRRLFYNDSWFDGNDPEANEDDDHAVAADKVALLPGQTATFANYSSYAAGINGVMVDIADLPATELTTDDFEFRVGNDNHPAGWQPGPQPSSITVRQGAGADGSDRVTIIWSDVEAIQNLPARRQWLEITVRATEATGLATPDVFYFGNAPGETGNSTADAIVGVQDVSLTRASQTGFAVAEIDNVFDFNRDGRVNAQDVTLVRNNQSGTTPLLLISPPATAP